MVSQYIGRGAAWFSILMAGAIGNGLNAYFYQTLHLSIGASTMVFAALGILGIFAINDRNAYFQTGLRRWAPLFATIALLGFLGNVRRAHRSNGASVGLRQWLYGWHDLDAYIKTNGLNSW